MCALRVVLVLQNKLVYLVLPAGAARHAVPASCLLAFVLLSQNEPVYLVLPAPGAGTKKALHQGCSADMYFEGARRLLEGP